MSRCPDMFWKQFYFEPKLISLSPTVRWSVGTYFLFANMKPSSCFSTKVWEKKVPKLLLWWQENRSGLEKKTVILRTATQKCLVGPKSTFSLDWLILLSASFLSRRNQKKWRISRLFLVSSAQETSRKQDGQISMQKTGRQRPVGVCSMQKFINGKRWLHFANFLGRSYGKKARPSGDFFLKIWQKKSFCGEISKKRLAKSVNELVSLVHVHRKRCHGSVKKAQILAVFCSPNLVARHLKKCWSSKKDLFFLGLRCDEIVYFCISHASVCFFRKKIHKKKQFEVVKYQKKTVMIPNHRNKTLLSEHLSWCQKAKSRLPRRGAQPNSK